jgi:hypothetical protein
MIEEEKLRNNYGREIRKGKSYKKIERKYERK